QPDILILDEVLSVGDESFKRKCKQRIDEFWNGNATILVVSHDLDFVQQSCERVVWIDKGKINFIGEPEKITNYYLQTIQS
ncbi:MAG: ABC transporter ATP-binding protein, partial [Sphaerospermopsis kisseleviana]